MKKINKYVSLLLSAVLLFGAAVLVPPAARAGASETFTVQVEGVCGQTEARGMLGMINDLRKPANAWYWNQTDTEKITPQDLAPLQYDYALEAVAMQRAAEIALSFSHTRPNGERCFTAYTGIYYHKGENIAIGYGSAENAFEAWCETNEPYKGQGHRRNMLGTFSAVGIGHVICNGYHCWVQEFGDPASSAHDPGAVDGARTFTVDCVPEAVDVRELLAEPLELEAGASAVPQILARFGYYGIARPAQAEITVKNTDVAYVQDGMIHALAAGTTEYTVTACGATVSADITVTATPGEEPPARQGAIKLRFYEEDGLLAAAVTAADCIGLKTVGFTLNYDPAALAFRYAESGRDDAEVLQTRNHQFTADYTDDASGTITGSFVFTPELVDAETYRADSKKSKFPADVNAENFEGIVFFFAFLNEDLASAAFTVTVTSATGVLPDGGTYTYYKEGAPVLTGDVDGSGEIEPGDARLALRISLGLMNDGDKVMTPEMQARADVDGKEGVQPADARLILRKSLGLVDEEWVG